MLNNSDIRMTTSKKSGRSFPEIRLSGRDFTCHHCNKNFVTEKAFLKHRCEQMKRSEELDTVRGQRALHLYNEWMKSMGKMPQNSSAFLKSQFFNSMIKFSDFVKQARLQRVEEFIRWAVKQKFNPPMWCLPQTFGAWMAYVSQNSSPMDLVRCSIETLEEIAEEAGVDISDVFSVMTGPELVHLVSYQQLSPWAILNSQKFKQFYLKHIKGEQKTRFDSFVDINRWGRTFAKHEKDRTIIKKLMIKIGL